MINTSTLENLRGKDRVRLMVEKSQIVIVFMTKQYSKKVTADYDNPTKEEFLTSMAIKGRQLMIPVALEDECDVLKEFSDKYTCNMSSFEYDRSQVSSISLSRFYYYLINSIQ